VQRPPLVGAMVLAVVPLLAGCRGEQQAVAANVAQLDIKATVAPAQTATVTAPFDGRIAALNVREGGIVKAGDIVATLSNPTVERDAASARVQLALAEYHLRHAGKPPRGAKVSEATEALVRARKSKVERYRGLYKTRDVSIEELENAEAEYAMALREREAYRQAPVTSDPELLRLEVEKARAEAALVADRQSRLTVTAPIAGIVTKLLVNQGESVFPRDPLMEIANAATLDVRGSIAPELMRYVRSGMPAEVKVFTVPPRRFTATIKNIIPPTDPSGATIVVSVPNPDNVLQPGTPAVITVR
jgi:HlyD family secretion protein